MATEVAQAYVQIMPSAQGIQSQLQSVLGAPLEQMGTTGGAAFGANLMGALSGAGIAAAAAAAGQKIGQVISDSIQTGMDFDKSMSQVAATMGTTVDQIADLRGFAMEMGATTAFSANQAADALNYMALAGYDAETAMGMLPTVLNLAAAGGMDLARASDMITDSQSALGLSLEDTGRMVDQMAMAASKSNTSVEQLGDAILTVGGTASYMAGGSKELATVLGVLADNGIKSAEGGTHLRNILLSMTSPTDKAKAKLEELGVQVFDAQGKMRSFADIFPDLSAALSSLSDQQKLDAMSTIFNSRDIASANALMHTSVDRWNELGAAIENSAGAAQRMADTQLDNLAGDITLMQSAAEGAKIALSDMLTPLARGGVQLATEGIGLLTDGLKELQEIGNSELLRGLKTDVMESFADAADSAGDAANVLGDAFETLKNAAATDGNPIHEALEDITESVGNFLELRIAEFGTGAEIVAYGIGRITEACGKIDEATGGNLDKIAEFLFHLTGLGRFATTMKIAGTVAGAAAEGLGNFADNIHYIMVGAGMLPSTTADVEGFSHTVGSFADGVGDAAEVMGHTTGSFGEAGDAMEEAGEGAEALADGMTEAATASEVAAQAAKEAHEGIIGVASAAIDARYSGGDLREEYEKLSAELEKLRDEGTETDIALAEQKLHLLNLAATNQELAEGYPTLTARLSDFGISLTQTSGWLIDNGITAEEWGSSVTGALSSVVSSFNEMDTDLDMSLETMAANLQKNITATTQWNENMRALWTAAASYAGEGGQEAATAFVSYMQQMGPAAAAQVAQMVTNVDGTLATFAPMFATAADQAMVEVYNGIQGTDLAGAVSTAAEGFPVGIEAQSGPTAAAAQQVAYNAALGAAGSADNFQTVGGSFMNRMASGITGGSGTVSGAALSVAMNAYNVAGSVPFYSVGYNIAQGIARGISGGSSAISSAAQAAVNNALAAAKSAAGIASPSRVFRDQVGGMIAAGVAVGISDGEREVSGSMRELVQAMTFGDQRFGTLRGSLYGGREQPGDQVQVTMNVYGAQGQSEERLAELVEQRLYRSYRSRKTGM